MKPLFLSVIFLCTGCAFLQRPDPPMAETFRQEAEALVVQQDYAAAAERFAAAIRLHSDSGTLYLRRGELLERNDCPAKARRNYQTGLKKISADDPLRPELVHRLALLLALKLDSAAEARPLLLQLPIDSPRRDDLLGVLASIEGNQREALLRFNAALAQNPDKNLVATILYHAALAYQRLGDEKNTSGSLYNAINFTSNLATARDIENLWNRLKAGGEQAADRQP